VLEVHFDSPKSLQYIKFGAGVNRAGDAIEILEIMPLRKATPSASPSQSPSTVPSQSPTEEHVDTPQTASPTSNQGVKKASSAGDPH
jgi:hypothetical protein